MVFCFYKLKVSNNCFLELSANSMKNKAITGLTYPGLVLVLSNLCMREVIILDLGEKGKKHFLINKI